MNTQILLHVHTANSHNNNNNLFSNNLSISAQPSHLIKLLPPFYFIGRGHMHCSDKDFITFNHMFVIE